MPPTKRTSPKAAALSVAPSGNGLTHTPASGPAATSDGAVGFFTWDELVAEAHIDRPPFRIKVSEDEIITIPCPSGDAFLKLDIARRTNDVVMIFANLFPDEELYMRMRELMKSADFPIVDNLAAKVLGHYYNAGGEPEGESRAS